MTPLNKAKIPFKPAMVMVKDYIKSKLSEQVKAVAFIIFYLVAFKIIVLNAPPADALQVSFGVGLVIFGLAFFLEGLFLGLMPLGERVGIQLPKKTNIAVIMGFGLLLGLGATLAEPAIASLRLAGANVTPWEAPLLYRLLEIDTNSLLLAIGGGVGVAVAFGMARFYFGIGIKPFIYTLVPLLVGFTAWFSRDPNLSKILNLAWDTGGVTTGPVTVPLVLAMGIGISHSEGKQETGASGFGLVALASLFPVIGVLALGAFLNQSTPMPCQSGEFFAKENRVNALTLVKNENELMKVAFQRGNEAARKAYFYNSDNYDEALVKLTDEKYVTQMLGDMSLSEWLTRKASSEERAKLALLMAGKTGKPIKSNLIIDQVLKNESILAFRAVVPLVLLLVAVLVFMLKDKPKKIDEVVLGIAFTLIGMAILTSGIRLGLAPLGDQVGRPLPQVFRSETHEEGRIILEPFDEKCVTSAFNQNGVLEKYFTVKDGNGKLQHVKFEPERFDRVAQRYEHIVERPPLFGPELTLVGIGLVFLFAFGMGYGSTIAEPALSALGTTVEEISVGTIKRKSVVNTVSLGVGIGILVGVARILYNIPMIWFLAPSYLALLVLTWFNDESFAGIAWDSGGVTTGPITVPLVLSMGLGIGGELNVVDGFGIVAMAAVFPILSMLVFGISVKIKQKRLLIASMEGENEN